MSFKKQDHTSVCCLQGTHFKCKSIDGLKVKEMKKYILCKWYWNLYVYYVNIHNKRASKHKAKTSGTEGRTDKSTIALGDFSIILSVIDTTVDR